MVKNVRITIDIGLLWTNVLIRIGEESIMEEGINIRKIENAAVGLKGIECILTHTSASEHFQNTNDVYMLQLLRDDIAKIRADLEEILEKVN